MHEGLVSDEIMGVCQDRKGYIWIATTSGVQRYDGHRFINFRHNSHDPSSLTDDLIMSMHQGEKNRLWLFFPENKAGYIDQLDMSFHPIPIHTDAKNWKTLEAYMTLDDSGNVYVRSLREGYIYTYREQTNEFAPDKPPFLLPEGWKVLWIYQEPKDNNYWLCCDSGLVKYNIKTRALSYKGHNADNDEIIEAYKDIRSTSHAYRDGSGRFWLASWPPIGPGPFLFSFDTRTKKMKEWEKSEFYPLLKGMYHEIYVLTEDENGNIWIGGKNIFIKLARGTEHFELIPNDIPGEFGIRYNLVRNLFQDREKNIWVASDRGLFKFNPSTQIFKMIQNHRPGRPDTAYTSDASGIIQTKNGDILVSTWGNGVFAYDHNFQPIHSVYAEPGIKGQEVLTWCIVQRANGDVWRGNQEGVYAVTKAGSTKSEVVYNPVFKRGTIRQIVEDKQHNLWFGSHNGLLVKMDSATTEFKMIFRTGSSILRLYNDKWGMLWVCTNNGLYRFDPVSEKLIATYNSDAPPGKRLSGVSCMDVIQYNDELFLIASAGLNILNIKTGTITYITSDSGLPSNSLRNIMIDKAGNIWLTTSTNLCRYIMQDSALTIFHEEDGIPAGNFNEAAATVLADGRMIFGRAHDIITFYPAPVKMPNRPAPGIEITGFSLMNTRLDIDSLKKLDHVQLDYNENSISIDFSTLTYLNRFSLSFKMDGLDNDWNINDGTYHAIYNYLPPGDYTFMVKQTNSPPGAPAMATIKITVKAPFWKTWWFYSILALVAAGLVFWEDRERMKRKGAVQRMRSDIAGNLHEEVNIVLNNISVLSEIARIKADKDPEQSKVYIGEIHEKSHDMIIAMDDMLWSIDPENDSMAKTIERIKEFADALRNRHGVLINLQADSKVTSLNADMKTRHEMMIIYKLALRLLVEEMHSSQTSIQLDLHRSQLQLNIFASAVKLPETNNNRIMHIVEEMKVRAASIKAILEIQSDEKGTAIIVAARN